MIGTFTIDKSDFDVVESLEHLGGITFTRERFGVAGVELLVGKGSGFRCIGFGIYRVVRA